MKNDCMSSEIALTGRWYEELEEALKNKLEEQAESIRNASLQHLRGRKRESTIKSIISTLELNSFSFIRASFLILFIMAILCHLLY